MQNHQLFGDIKRIKSIADIGLLYSINSYDQERYNELHEISLRLLNQITEHEIETLKISFPIQPDYPTAKVDIRGLVLQDNKILLVKEAADGKWSLPGGWADVGYTPKEVIVKEIKEETGLDATVESLLAVFDKRMHPHPYQPFYVYKMFFHCKVPSTQQINKGFEVLDAAYFDINNLPQLSEDRVLKSQVELVYKKAMDGNSTAYFD